MIGQQAIGVEDEVGGLLDLVDIGEKLRSVARGADDGLAAVAPQAPGLWVKEFRNLMLAPMPLLLFFGVLFQVGQLCAEPANQTIIDLDQPAKFHYRLDILTKLPIGSKPGEIGIETLEDSSLRGPNLMVLDRHGYIYINDEINRRVQKFSGDGKFQAIVFSYPFEAHGPGNMAVDSRGHLFLLMKHKETWEIWRGKVLKKHPKELLPKPWLTFSGRKTIVSQPDPSRVDVFISVEASGKQKKISFQTKKTINPVSTALETQNAIFFQGGVGNTPFTYELNLENMEGKLIFLNSKIFSVDMGRWVFSGMSADGGDHSLHFDEVDGVERYYCEILKLMAVPHQ